jgi:hypothetical protein
MKGYKPGFAPYLTDIIKTGDHGRMTKKEAKAFRDKWSAKIHGTCDSDNGDNSPQSVTPP